MEQYVNEQGKRFWRGTSRWAWRTWIAAVAAAIAFELILKLVDWLGQPNPGLYLATPGFPYEAFVSLMAALVIAALLLGLVSGILFLRLTIVSRQKRRQVLDAIDRSQPGSASVWRGLGAGLAVPIGLITGLLAGYLFSGTLGTQGYRALNSRHLILAILVGSGTTLVMLSVSRHPRRPREP